jgi:hypothetical protein
MFRYSVPLYAKAQTVLGQVCIAKFRAFGFCRKLCVALIWPEKDTPVFALRNDRHELLAYVARNSLGTNVLKWHRRPTE